MMSKKKSAKSLSRPLPMMAPKKTAFDGENDIQFEVELCWCVQQLREALDSGKLSQKVAEDTGKNLNILMSKNAPLIKKRQTMKLALGDYRAKMQQEAKKMVLAPKQIKFTPAADVNKKSSFVKRSALLTSGKDFRFNFAVPENSNTKDEMNAKTEMAPSPKSLRNALQGTDGAEFKFNFSIDDGQDDINFSSLLIKE